MVKREPIIIPLGYNPHPIFFIPFFQNHRVILDDVEAFEKNSIRTKTTLIGSQGIQELRIPVKAHRGHIPVSRVRIEHASKWARDHFRCIKSNYGKAPFYVFLEDSLIELYQKKHEFLFDFNLELFRLYLRVLRIREFPDLLSGIKKEEKMPEKYRLNSLESMISNLSSPGGGALISYPQLFGNEFAPSVGILDLIMCQGPDGRSYLKGISEQNPDFKRFCGKNY